MNSIILARVLGPEERGEVIGATLLPLLMLSLGALGLYEAILFHAAQNRDSLNSIITISLLLSVFLGIASIILTNFLLPVMLGHAKSSTLMLAKWFQFMIPFGMIHISCSSIIRGLARMNTYNILQLIIPGGMAIGVALFSLAGVLNLSSAVVLHLFLTIVASIMSFIAMLNVTKFSNLELNIELASSMLKYGVRVYAGNVFVTANARLDQLLLVPLVSATQVGYYAIAVKVAEITGYFATVIMIVSVPRLAAINSKEQQIQAAIFLYRQYWWPSVLFKLLVCPLIYILLPVVYGEQYKPAILITLILVMASIFHDGKKVLSGIMQSLNHPWSASKAEIFAVIVTLILLPIVIPLIGIAGAALVSFISYGVAMTMLATELLKRYKLSPRRVFSVPDFARKLKVFHVNSHGA